MTRQKRRQPVCSTCNRTFKRMEHCLRHERAHNRERPYICQFCSQSFGRQDLVVRHERNLHPELWAALHDAKQSLAAGDHQRKRLRSLSAASDKQELSASRPLPSPPSSQITNEDKEQGCQANLDHNGSNIVDQTVFMSPDTIEIMDIMIEDSSLMPVTQISAASNYELFQMGSNPHRESPGLAKEPPKTPPQPTARANLTSSSDSLLPVQLSTCAAEGNSESVYGATGYVNIIPEQNIFTENFPDFDMSLHLLGTPFNAMSGTYQTPQAQPYNNIPEPTWPADGGTITNLHKMFSRVPRLINDALTKPKAVDVDVRKRNEILVDFTERMNDQLDHELDVPDCRSLQRFLHRFLESFNTHLPIFHLPTFDIARFPSPLVLAMCSIGAMYELELKRAQCLRDLSSHGLNASDLRRQKTTPTLQRPVWMVQCKLLILYGAILGGNAVTASSALEELGYLHKEYTFRRARLSIEYLQTDVLSLNWQEWIERESSKRLLYGIFILDSLLTITYNISPGLSTSSDLDLELPEEECLWTAPTNDSWKESLVSTSTVKRLNTSRVLTQLVFGKTFGAAPDARLGLYAAIVLVHAVNIHTWHVSQSTHYFTNFLVDQDLEAQVARRCLRQVEIALDRCSQVFAGIRRIEDGPPQGLESPLPFNGLNLLRSCYARVFCTDKGGFYRSVLLSEDDIEISKAAKNFVNYTDFDVPLLTKIVAFMLEIFQLPAHVGRMVIRKTAALSWSVETAVTLWDCALYSTKWIQTVFKRPDHNSFTPLEQKLINEIRQFTSTSQDESSERFSMAAILANTLASHFDDVWVWQVTVRMARILRKLADAYDENWLEEIAGFGKEDRSIHVSTSH